MARSSFDFKKFLLEKGERVGLWAAVGFMVLLIVFSLFMPGSGFLSGSQSANAEVLKKKVEAGRAKIKSATPPGDLGQIPVDLRGDHANQLRIAAGPFRGLGDAFSPHPPDNSKRRMPKIYPPTEGKGMDLLVQIRSYIFQPGTGKVGVIKGLEAGASQLGGNRPPTGFRPGSGGRGPGGPGNMMQPGGGRGMMPGAAGNPGSAGGGRPGFGGGTGPTGQVDAGVKEGKFEWDDIDKVDNLDELAEIIKPMAIAEVVAAFPFKKQVEEFRDALHKQTVGELFQDPRGIPTIKDIVVERSELLPDGTNTPWAKVDFHKEYLHVYVEGGKRREAEDKDLQPLLEYSLLMPRPLQYREGRYANLERQLPVIESTLKAIKEAGKVNLPKSLVREKFDKTGIDPFDRGGDAGGDAGGNPMGVRPQPPGGNPADPGSPAGSDDTFVPEACLVRFLDVTVEPGKTYDYRMQIVMLNPNYKEVDKVAFPEIAREETLKSSFTPWTVRVSVQPDLAYYVVDEKEIERGKEGKRKYNGAPDVSGDKERVAMQIHKWFAGVVPPGNTVSFSVGEWLLADRIVVHRGEYIGRTDKAEVPIWLPTRKGFVIAVNPRNRGTKKEIDANFGFEKGMPDEAILVDFEGGKVSYDRTPERSGDDKKATPTRIHDTAPIEVLILMPDGRLLARDSKTDTSEEKRGERRAAWHERIDEVKGKSVPKKPMGTGTDIFDNKPK